MTVKAPFRFARINRWIYTPAWGRLASHDVPFADGLSGTATLTITARTPLVVGGRRRTATADEAGEVWPVRLPDGRWALPRSSLQGLCRQILEVAAFGRLGPWIEERRFGIRDITGSATGRLHYGDRLTRLERGTIIPRSRAGWLVKIGGRPTIIPCAVSRIGFGDVAAIRAEKHPAGAAAARSLQTLLENGGNDARARCEAYLDGLGGPQALEHWFTIQPARDHWHNSINANIRESLCAPARGGGGIPGTLVFTGKVGGPNPMGPRRKKREFVFHGFSRAQVVTALASPAGVAGLPHAPLPVDDLTWQAFAFMHFGIDGSGRKSPAWELWEAEYNAGRPVPVFWWEEERKVATFGMAFAFKAAYPLSTHDLLRHSHPDHLTGIDTAEPDLPHLIFGMAAEGDGGRGLKRRACFGLGLCTQPNVPMQRTGRGVLSSPKPKYLGLYVRQRAAKGNRLPQQGNGAEPMAAYASVPAAKATLASDITTAEARRQALDNLARPELAGVKLWPASGRTFPRQGEILLPPPPAMQPPAPIAEKVKVRLNVLPAGTTFTVPLTFHNLRPVELGALLWALSFGDRKAFGAQDNRPRLRHRLGMGKPFGFGEVEIAVAGPTCDDAPDPCAAGDFPGLFAAHMEQVYPKPGKWAASPQVRALLRAADPTQNRAEDLRYMDVNTPGPDSYASNRANGDFLAPYADDPDAELPKPGADPTPAPGGAPPTRPGAAAGGAPAAPTGPAPGPAPGPALAPEVGARVRIKRTGDRSIWEKEAVIEAVGGKCTLRLDDNRTVQLRPTLFTIIAPPERP